MFEDIDEDDSERDVRDLPIYKKGREIQDVVRTLAELMPEENEYLQSLKGEMLLQNFHILLCISNEIPIFTQMIIQS